MKPDRTAEQKPCRCQEKFRYSGLMCDGLDTTARVWFTLVRDYDKKSGDYIEGTERCFVELVLTEYYDNQLEREEIFFCPWCGRKFDGGTATNNGT